jgi:chromosome segregation ATPase
MGHDMAELEAKHAKLQADYKDLERTLKDQTGRLEARIGHLEDYEAKSEAKLINTRRALEQDELAVQKAQRELEDWIEKCGQAEKRRDQLDFTLRGKEEELSGALTDAQAERALRQKLEIQNDGLKHQNTVLKEELRTQLQQLQTQLAETLSMLELEQVARRKAEEKVEELRACAIQACAI